LTSLLIGFCQMRISLNVNDQAHVVEADGGESLAELLRTRLELTGTKVACGEGTCGSCTVLLDGRAVLSCLTLAAACDGATVRTIESGGPLLERLQQAFTAEDGFQCGFCTPGQLMSAVALLERTPHPGRDEIVQAMSGNLCRCGAYEGIGRAVARAAEGG
jgi:xanthine dehydrogenase YagT iron-sulfur-binding subunit